MKWRAEAVALAAILAMPVVAQELPPESAGPSATSNQDNRYDAIGHAGVSAQTSGLAHATLPIGSHVEVTSLDTGRTALFAVTEAMSASPVELVKLPATAMEQLGIRVGAGVRVRTARPTLPEVATLRSGQAAIRLDAPPALLAGLRKGLAPSRVVSSSLPLAAATPARGAPIPVPPRASNAKSLQTKSGWGVQVAALSNETRAKVLASDLGGTARPGRNIWRIQLGPFNDRTDAEAARTRIAGRGHPQATLVHIP